MTIKGKIKTKIRKYRYRFNTWYYNKVLTRLFKHYEEDITEWCIDNEILLDYYREQDEDDYYLDRY